MKIIYLADIHGAFARVKELLSGTDAQVYVIGGDLIDKPFYTEEKAARYRTLQSRLALLQYRFDSGDTGIDDFVEELLDRRDLPAEVRGQAMEYRDLTVRARRVLQQKYKVLESILSLKGNSQVFCLPGNYDMDLQYTSLHARDLHRHWRHAAELRIAGYGGADVATPGIPQKYCVPYRADRGRSEMSRFFAETRPDIIVTHKPAHGIHDHVAPMGESGSTELRNYCEENRVPLCLTGHIHDQWGFKDIDGTIYLNPSNFGEVQQPGGTVSEGGFFYTIEISEFRVSLVTLSKLVGGDVREVAAYALRNGRWVEKISDSDRFGALLRGRNHDNLSRNQDAFARSEMLQKMRYFFPGPAAGEDPAQASEEIRRALPPLKERHGASISVDLLGQKISGGAQDLAEVVLYFESGEGKSPDIPEMVEEFREMCPRIRIADCISLEQVKRAVAEQDYECDAALLFAAYRSYARPLFGAGADSVETCLNAMQAFRGEIEGTGCAYMEIFRNIAARVENMRLFEARLRDLGIAAPEAYKRKIREILHGVKGQNKKADQDG